MSGDDRDWTTPGKRLQWARESLRKYGSQGMLAKAIGVTRHTVMRWEADEYLIPLDQLDKVAEALDLRPRWLQYGEGPPYVLPAVKAYLQGPKGVLLPSVVREELSAWSHNFFGTLSPNDELIEQAILVIEILLARARKREDGDKGA